MNCEPVREMLPWYVTGEVEIETASRIAEHLATCSACQTEFVEAAWMRRLVVGVARQKPGPRRGAWGRVARRAGLREIAQIDVGSLLIGLNLGVSLANRHHPIRGTLRVMGHNVRITGTRRRKEEARVQKG